MGREAGWPRKEGEGQQGAGTLADARVNAWVVTVKGSPEGTRV